jgi:hypothetical protein
MIKNILKRLCEENKSFLDKERLKIKKILLYSLYSFYSLSQVSFKSIVLFFSYLTTKINKIVIRKMGDVIC